MQIAPTRAQLLAAERPAFLLTLIWGGRVYRLATSELDIEDADGEVYSYTGGLSWPEYIEESSQAGGVQDAGPSVPFDVVLDGVDIAEEQAAGRWLDVAEGELSMVFLDGSGACLQVWEDRIRLVVGRPSQPVYGDPEQPEGWCSFSLESMPYDDSATLLAAAERIDENTWPQADDSNGRPYPVVIGTPGLSRTAEGVQQEKPGSPAYPVEYSGANVTRLLICGEEVVADTVVIWDESNTSEAFTVEHVKDGKGRLVATVDVSVAVSITRTDTQFWVEWSDGGGIKNPFGSGALSRLGDVCAWALLRARTRVDLPAWINESGLLNRYRVDTYINDAEVSPWEFVTRLLEEIPMEVRAGVDGTYPRTLQPELLDGEVLGSVEEGVDFYPVGPVVTLTSLGDIVNRVSISFAMRAKDGGFRRTLTFTDSTAPDDPDQHPDQHAIFSQSRYGPRGVMLEIDWIYEESTAAALARAILRTKGCPWRSRPYTADYTWGWLRVGDALRFTSAGLHLTDAIVRVASKTWNGVGWEFTLVWFDDPVRRPG